MFESNLRQFIDVIREDDQSEGVWRLPPHGFQRASITSLIVSLARFQSYRGRTEAALIQELTGWIEESGVTVLHFVVHDEDSLVQIW